MPTEPTGRSTGAYLAPVTAPGHLTHDQPRRHKTLFGGLLFTIILLGSVALAIYSTYPAIAIWAVSSVLALVVVFHYALKASDFFGVIFANSIAIYTCLYIVFASSNFPKAASASLQGGFVLPLLAFAVGILARRGDLHRLMSETPRAHTTVLQGASGWMGSLAIVAIATSFLRIPSWAPTSQDAGLVISMGVIAAVAWLASRKIALFLMETGVVFRAFFANAARLLRPAFALLTCYSLVIILFGSVYTVFDHASALPNFTAMGVPARMEFPEGLYLSVATLSMVGFGDITPVTPVARLLVSVEILCGVVLLLFGVEAMLARGQKLP